MIDRVHPSGEQTIFLNNTVKNMVPVDEFVLEEKVKLLKACLEIMILEEVSQRAAMCPLDVIVFCEKNYDIRLSPGTIYPVLRRMEAKGYIKTLPDRRKKIYVLSKSGEKALKNFYQCLEEVNGFFISLLNKSTYQRRPRN